jgi:haloalkane dehalogenase
VKRFVVFNTAAFFGPMPFRIRICRTPLLGDVLVRRLNLFVRGAIQMACRRRERMTPDVARGYSMPYRNYADRIGVHRFVRDIPLSPSIPSHSILESIEAALPRFRDRRMAIFWGGKDFCFNETYLQGWIERFPQADVHRLPEAGHYVVEDAFERILPPLRDFLHEHRA